MFKLSFGIKFLNSNQRIDDGAWAELIPRVNKAVQMFVTKELKTFPYSTQVSLQEGKLPDELAIK